LWNKGTSVISATHNYVNESFNYNGMIKVTGNTAHFR